MSGIFMALKNPEGFSTRRKGFCVSLKFSGISGRLPD